MAQRTLQARYAPQRHGARAEQRRRAASNRSGLTVELVGIDTRGDRITDVPLSQVDGKAFFTAEIDAALQRGDVNLTVHSFKDLSLERPAELCLGAVPRRENPRDIVIFAAGIAEHLACNAGAHRWHYRRGAARWCRISPARALPGNPAVQLCELRGNVDTRLRRARAARRRAAPGRRGAGARRPHAPRAR
ncbi:MAG: hypothetical protein U1F30_06000 [Steroidobacteraceae bacterium]